LKAGRVFQIEAGLVFEVVGEEFGFDASAELLADRLGVVEIAEMAGGGGSVAVAPGTEDEEVPVMVVVGLEAGVFLLRAEHVFLVVVAAHGEGGHGDRVERALDAA